MSDRQKGLVQSFELVMPNTEHRFCVRHLYANFKLYHKDLAFKDLMWAAACSYLEDGFNEKMNEIKAISVAAYDWLKKVPPHQWCKYLQSPRPKCDILSNNMNESFKNYVKEAREMPILTMMESLRRQFMCRFQEKRPWIEKYNGIICPRIQTKLDLIKLKSLDFEAFEAAEGLWEITSTSKQWVVNLRKHICSCREWDLTGIPCAHATCAILMKNKKPEDYVSPYYSVAMYKIACSYIIHPVPDHSQWSPSSNEETMPIRSPIIRRQPGRPPKERKKGPDEINVRGKVTKMGTIQSCSNCGATTHNIATCNMPCNYMASTSATGAATTADTTSTQASQSNISVGRGRGRGINRGMEAVTEQPSNMAEGTIREKGRARGKGAVPQQRDNIPEESTTMSGGKGKGTSAVPQQPSNMADDTSRGRERARGKCAVPQQPDNIPEESTTTSRGRGTSAVPQQPSNMANGTSRGRGRARGRARGRVALPQLNPNMQKDIRRDRGRPRGRGSVRGKGAVMNGPLNGFGNWNGLGMSTMTSFRPHQMQIPITNGASASTTWNSPTTQNLIQADGSQLCDNVQVQKFNTRFGGVIFSSKSSSNKYSVTTDNGDSSNPT